MTYKQGSDDYPMDEDVGTITDWVLPLAGGDLRFRGQFLGWATSKQDTHSHAGAFAPDSRKCPGCRWFEPRLFRESDGDRRFVLYTVGCSDVPGEVDHIRYRFARDAHEAVFTMTASRRQGTGPGRFLSAPARGMFDQAVRFESEIATALEQQGAHGASDNRTVWQS